ncbi:unnamed protein product [Linum trigynum]|uniref:Uncharacterized protein n=1 Tax=Linum trigynum TaxID=586398 RepID=A0AAV2DB93_9ROSI
MDPFGIVTPNIYLTADDILDEIAIAVEGEDTDDSDSDNNDADDTSADNDGADDSDDDGPVEAVATEPEGEVEPIPDIEVHWISSDEDSDSDDSTDSTSGTPSLAEVLVDLRDMYYSE